VETAQDGNVVGKRRVTERLRERGGVLKKSAELCTCCDLAKIWRGVGESVCAMDTLAKEISQSVCRRSRTRGVAEKLTSSGDGFRSIMSKTRRVQLDLDR